MKNRTVSMLCAVFAALAMGQGLIMSGCGNGGGTGTGGAGGQGTGGQGQSSQSSGSQSSGSQSSGSQSSSGQSSTSSGMMMDGGGSLCTNTGGTESMGLCCLASGDFPDTCLVGACGCAPGSSHMVKTCNCPAGQCYSAQLGCKVP